jgi:hypothetical protein
VARAIELARHRRIRLTEVCWLTMEIQLPRPILRIVFRCSEQTKAELLSRMQIHEGMMLSDELLQRTREAAKAYNERVAIVIRQSIRQEDVHTSDH